MFAERSVPMGGLPLLIFGASIRAAAMSAVKAGLRPLGADLFADTDLQAIVSSGAVSDFPQEFLEIANRVKPCDWIYTGALENEPALIRAISERHRLLGNSPEQLLGVRDPFVVTEFLQSQRSQSHGSQQWTVLPIRSMDDSPPRDGTWLWKPLRSAAGRGIVVWDKSVASSAVLSDGCFQQRGYFQQLGTGESFSAVFLAADNGVELLGITQQLVGETALCASPFGYCGSIGPVNFSPMLERSVRCMGESLGKRFALRGLFGIDFLRHKETIIFLEVNPRYTASVEVLERSSGRCFLAEHRAACLSFESPMNENGSRTEAGHQQRQPFVGKAILFADRDLIAPLISNSSQETEAASFSQSDSLFADLPKPGTRISYGEPICTLFATADSLLRCREQLFQRAEKLLARCDAVS